MSGEAVGVVVLGDSVGLRTAAAVAMILTIIAIKVNVASAIVATVQPLTASSEIQPAGMDFTSIEQRAVNHTPTRTSSDIDYGVA